MTFIILLKKLSKLFKYNYLMNLNSNPKTIKLFTLFRIEYESKLEKDLYHRYSKDSEKLNFLIEYLEVNSIDVDDENIQIEVNNFLEYLSMQDEEYSFNDEDQKLIVLKLVKLKLEILHKIKNNELDGISLVEANIKKIQSKKYINVKEFQEIYDISQSSQRDYRGRLHNPLPYHQKVFRGKILYDVSEVEKWLENEYK